MHAETPLLLRGKDLSFWCRWRPALRRCASRMKPWSRPGAWAACASTAARPPTCRPPCRAEASTHVAILCPMNYFPCSCPCALRLPQ